MWWNVYNMLASKRPEPEFSESLDDMVQKISSDIARLTEDEREQVKADLAHHAREWCLRDISHDLRTPLNAIIGFTQLMESGMFGPVGNPQYLEYLRHIRESGYELLDKVEDLVDTVSPRPSLTRAQLPKAPRKPVRMKEAVA